jgi:hypothetical protein
MRRSLGVGVITNAIESFSCFLIGFDKAFFWDDELLAVGHFELVAITFDSEKDSLERLSICTGPSSGFSGRGEEIKCQREGGKGLQ